MLRRIRIIFWKIFTSASLAFSGTAAGEMHTSFTGIDSIRVNGLFCDVDILGDDGETVSLDADIKPAGPVINKDRFQISYKKTGNELQIWVEDNNVFGFGSGYQGNITISAPRKIMLNAVSVSGNIMARGFQSDDVYLESKSGNITMHDVRGEVKGQTISGNIFVNNMTGTMRLKTISGDIQGAKVWLEKDSFFETISGNIFFQFLNKKQDMGFDLESVSGGIQTGNSRTQRQLVTTGGKVQVCARTVSGEQVFDSL